MSILTQKCRWTQKLNAISLMRQSGRSCFTRTWKRVTWKVIWTRMSNWIRSSSRTPYSSTLAQSQCPRTSSKGHWSSTATTLTMVCAGVWATISTRWLSINCRSLIWKRMVSKMLAWQLYWHTWLSNACSSTCAMKRMKWALQLLSKSVRYFSGRIPLILRNYASLI